MVCWLLGSFTIYLHLRLFRESCDRLVRQRIMNDVSFFILLVFLYKNSPKLQVVEAKLYFYVRTPAAVANSLFCCLGSTGINSEKLSHLFGCLINNPLSIPNHSLQISPELILKGTYRRQVSRKSRCVKLWTQPLQGRRCVPRESSFGG